MILAELGVLEVHLEMLVGFHNPRPNTSGFHCMETRSLETLYQELIDSYGL